MKHFVSLVVVLGLAIPLFSSAHPGRTDASGCHTCRTNCANWGLATGEYHCHNAKAVPQPLPPVKSTYGENGTGYVSPAPEYAIPKTVSVPKPVQATTTSQTARKVVPKPTKSVTASQSIVQVTKPTSTTPQVPKKQKSNWFTRLFK